MPPLVVMPRASFLFQTGCGVLYGYRQGDVNYEMAADWLLENGYTQGYATFWNANVLTELTDGQIEVFAVENWDTGSMNPWLQRKDHAQRTPEGRVFAIFRASELEAGVPGCDEEHLIYASDELAVVVYDSDEEFQAARRGE